MKRYQICNSKLICATILCSILFSSSVHANDLYLVSDRNIPFDSLVCAGYRCGYATSTLDQKVKYNKQVDNSVSKLMDLDPVTSWQEGAAGYGIGEGVRIDLDDTYEIQYLSFCLGNWRNENYYYGNARPKALKIRIGDKFTRTVTFPNRWEQFYVELEYPVTADHISFQIADIYEGNKWTDTCISEVEVYALDDVYWEEVYILPESDSRYLRESDLKGMTIQDLAYARNEIYARHGYIFKAGELKDYFGFQSWYVPTTPGAQFDHRVLNKYEKYNVEFLSRKEKEKNPNGYKFE